LLGFSKIRERFFWYSSLFHASYSVDFNSLREIRLGQNTIGFEINGKKSQYDGKAFSIISFDGVKMKMLNLVAPNVEVFNIWIAGLDMLASQYCLLHNLPDIGMRRTSRSNKGDACLVDVESPNNVSRDIYSTDSPVSPPSASSFSRELEDILCTGSIMLKIPGKASSRAQERFVRVELSPLRLLWDSKKQIPRTCMICFSYPYLVRFDCIREIRTGQNTKSFELHGKDSSLKSRSFSVVYFDDVKYGTLNFIARSERECIQWCSGLLGLLKRLESSDDSDPLQNQLNISKWLLNTWNQVDIKRENALDLDRVTEVCRKLNVALSKSELKSAFKNALIQRGNSIPFDEFERLYCNLRFRNDISDLFSRLCNSDPAGLSFLEFQQFVLVEQKVSISDL
jgi:hypothetical protein